MKQRASTPFYCVVLWLTCLALPAAEKSAITLTGRAMGTTWSVKFLPPSSPTPALEPTALTARVAATLEHLESIFSTYRPHSELSRFNTSATPSPDWFPVSRELAHVAAESHRISQLTAGALDATVDPLVRLWGFGPQRRPAHAPLPSPAEITAARALVDYRRLEFRLAPPALRKAPTSVSSPSSPSSPPNAATTLTADFSSSAKGFASDTLSTLLTSLGAPDHLVQVGGDLKTSGTHPWRTAIEYPSHASSSSASSAAPPSLARVVTLSHHALSTSGDTRNFFTAPGSSRRYSHIIDPRTGQPASSALASVSVIHPSSATSSALATALFVLGPEAGLALARREHLAALFILRDRDANTFTLHTTPAFETFASPAAPP